jgi:drug/metabolite transporter (DMT)-like permease
MQKRLQPLVRSLKPADFRRLMIAALVAVLSFNAVGILVYSSLGQSLNSTAGRYSLVLYVVMLVTTIAFAAEKHSSRIARMISLGTAAATVGFYYGGRAINLPLEQQAPYAITGAVVAALVAGGLSFVKVSWVKIALESLRTIVIYAMAFLNGSVGLMLLSLWQWWGFGLVAISLFCLGMTGRSLMHCFKLAIDRE